MMWPGIEGNREVNHQVHGLQPAALPTALQSPQSTCLYGQFPFFFACVSFCFLIENTDPCTKIFLHGLPLRQINICDDAMWES